MGARSDWLREERRKTLGDWVAFCLGCGHAQRYFAEREEELVERCPQCGAPLRSSCPACGARVSSMFAVACERCAAELRPATQFGAPIRKPGR